VFLRFFPGPKIPASPIRGPPFIRQIAVSLAVDLNRRRRKNRSLRQQATAPGFTHQPLQANAVSWE
jgi:hypothetical protein